MPSEEEVMSNFRLGSLPAESLSNVGFVEYTAETVEGRNSGVRLPTRLHVYLKHLLSPVLGASRSMRQGYNRLSCNGRHLGSVGRYLGKVFRKRMSLYETVSIM
jgi:hypothetical protein